MNFWGNEMDPEATPEWTQYLERMRDYAAGDMTGFDDIRTSDALGSLGLILAVERGDIQALASMLDQYQGGSLDAGLISFAAHRAGDSELADKALDAAVETLRATGGYAGALVDALESDTPPDPELILSRSMLLEWKPVVLALLGQRFESVREPLWKRARELSFSGGFPDRYFLRVLEPDDSPE